MPTLRELQAAIGTAMLGGDAGIAAREIEPDGLAPEARLEIYRHHVLTTLASALEATFPVICRLVDRRFFAYARYMVIASSRSFFQRSPPGSLAHCCCMMPPLVVDR